MATTLSDQIQHTNELANCDIRNQDGNRVKIKREDTKKPALKHSQTFKNNYVLANTFELHLISFFFLRHISKWNLQYNEINQQADFI